MGGVVHAKRKLLCLACAALLVFGMAGCVSADKSGGSGSATSSEVVSLPASFDLRDVDTDGDGKGDACYVTSVKRDGPFGICCSFAAISAAETSVLSQGLEDDASTLDFSEKQLAYFMHKCVNDASSPQNGEGYHIRGEDTEDVASEKYYDIESIFSVKNALAMGIGPVYESVDPSLEYRGKDGTKHDANYAADDDWSIDEKYHFLQNYLLKEFVSLPSPAEIVYENGAAQGEYSFNEKATQAMKEQIYGGNAIVFRYFADESTPWRNPGSEGLYMNTKTWAHYCWRLEKQNYAAVIVGWDDNYSASNFSVGEMIDPNTGDTVTRTQPPANGAWLVKNSWGAGTEEFPNKGTGSWGIPQETTDESGNTVTVGSGYFWISYYDQSLSNPCVLKFDNALKNDAMGYNYKPSEVIRDQHDFMPVVAQSVLEGEEKVQMANVFCATQDENVMCVSYEVASPKAYAAVLDGDVRCVSYAGVEPKTKVEFEVYQLKDGYTSPTDGELKASGTAFYEYGGFYLSFFTPMLEVKKGQSYSIVVTQSDQSGTYYVVTPKATGGNGSRTADRQQYLRAVMNPGESFVNMGDGWKDWSAKETRLEVDGSVSVHDYDVYDLQYDNFPLKGYAVAKK